MPFRSVAKSSLDRGTDVFFQTAGRGRMVLPPLDLRPIVAQPTSDLRIAVPPHLEQSSSGLCLQCAGEIVLSSALQASN